MESVSRSAPSPRTLRGRQTACPCVRETFTTGDAGQGVVSRSVSTGRGQDAVVWGDEVLDAEAGAASLRVEQQAAWSGHAVTSRGRPSGGSRIEPSPADVEGSKERQWSAGRQIESNSAGMKRLGAVLSWRSGVDGMSSRTRAERTLSGRDRIVEQRQQGYLVARSFQCRAPARVTCRDNGGCWSSKRCGECQVRSRLLERTEKNDERRTGRRAAEVWTSHCLPT